MTIVRILMLISISMMIIIITLIMIIMIINKQAFQLTVPARYQLGVPKP